MSDVHWMCILQGHAPDMSRWLITRPAGMYGPDADVPGTLNPCARCGAWTAPQLPQSERHAWRDGHAAFTRGQPRHANPYPADFTNAAWRLQWCAGYDAAADASLASSSRGPDA